jgi:hypothetical protein
VSVLGTDYTIRRGEARQCPECHSAPTEQVAVAVIDHAFALGGQITLESWECAWCKCRHRDGRALPSL